MLSWERDSPSWPNHELSRFVTAGGIRWHVQQAGNGPTLLLLHGTGASTHSWRDLIPILAEHYTVLAADLPGHAFTDPASAARSSLEGMSALLAALLRELRFAPQFAVGHSAGAVIACRMALSQAMAPRVIIAINGAFLPLGGFAGMLFAPIAKLLASTELLPRLLARRAADPARVARVLEGTGSRLDSAGIDLYARLVRDPQHLAGALRMMSNWNLQTFEHELTALRTPLTLMAADNDRAVPLEQAASIARRVAGASLITLPGLGHLAHEEAPAMMARRIIDTCRAHAA